MAAGELVGLRHRAQAGSNSLTIDSCKFRVAKSVNRSSTPIGLAKVDPSRTNQAPSGKKGASSIGARLPLQWGRAIKS
jgi:hypothetical protein